MSVFVCDRCGSVDNTALTLFWIRGEYGPALCSACDPGLGESWHGFFPREQYDPAKHSRVVNRKSSAADPAADGAPGLGGPRPGATTSRDAR